MKCIIIFLSFTLVLLNVTAQDSFKTGDVEFDTDLKKINAKAKVDFGNFKIEMAGTYDIEEKKIEQMHIELSMEPAEIHLAMEIGKITGKDINEVLEVYKLHKGEGWGVIAKELGIKPGSEQFHMLKNSMKKNQHQPNQDNTKEKSKGKNKTKKSKK